MDILLALLLVLIFNTTLTVLFNLREVILRFKQIKIFLKRWFHNNKKKACALGVGVSLIACAVPFMLPTGDAPPIDPPPTYGRFGNWAEPEIFNVTATETENIITINTSNNFTWKFFKDTAGYNEISHNGSILVENEQWRLEYQHNPNLWKRCGTPYNVTYEQLEPHHVIVTRKYMGSGNSPADFNVTFDFYSNNRVKITLSGDIGQADTYRVRWDASGINTENIEHNHSSNRTKIWNGENENDSMVFDYLDVYESFGNITSVEVEHQANNHKLHHYFNVGELDVGGFEFDPTFGFDTITTYTLTIIYNGVARRYGYYDSPISSGIGDNMSIYIDAESMGSGDNVVFKLVIYEYVDNTTNYAGAVLGTTVSHTFNDGDAVDVWITLDFDGTAPSFVADTRYYLSCCVISETLSGVDKFYMGTGATGTGFTIREIELGVEDPWVGDVYYLSYGLNIICSYTEGAANTAPTITGEVPANASTAIFLQPTCNVTVTDADSDTMDVTFASNYSGAWVNYQTNSTVSTGTSVEWDTTGKFNTASTKYWWKVYCNDATVNVSEWYYFTTAANWSNTAPTLTNEIPTNASTDISRWCQLNITVTDADGNNSNVYWYTNASGSWYLMQTNNTVLNTTVRLTNFTNASSYSTKYWWKVSANDTHDNTTEIYHFTTESTDTTHPNITINFAGNLSDKGGPYWRPPGESTQLAGAWSDGYYTNDSRQHEDWIYINVTANDSESSVTNVWLQWYNASSGWTNYTYAFANTVGEYWDYNTSGNIQTQSGHNYSFNIVANSTGGSNCSWWNKTGVGGGYTRRHVQLNCSLVNITYTPYYFRAETTYGLADENKNDRLHHDQGADDTTHDTGLLVTSVPPVMPYELVYCLNYVGFWYDESQCVESFTLDNIYYHVWWNELGDDVMNQIGWYKSRVSLSQITSNYYSDNGSNGRSKITAGSYEYNLTTHLLDITNTDFTENDIYELAVKMYDLTSYPMVVINRSVHSFVLFNVPDNATLNASHADTDSDGLSDWTELYVTYTNPFLADTDNDGVTDYDESLSGSDPNNYTDTTPYVGNVAPTQNGIVPANASVDISLTPALYVLCKDDDADNMNATWSSNSSGGWVDFATNTSIANNTNITQTNSNFSAYSTKYYWRVNLSDGNDGYINETYYFTTIGGYNDTIRNNGIDYMVWMGENVSAYHIGQNMTGFDEAAEYIAIWNETETETSTYFGNTSGLTRDLWQTTDDVIVGTAFTSGSKTGNAYQIKAFIANSAMGDGVAKAAIYNWTSDTDASTRVGYTNEVTISPNEAGSWITFTFPNESTNIEANTKYFLVVMADDVFGGQITLGYNSTTSVTSIQYNTASQYPTFMSPLVGEASNSDREMLIYCNYNGSGWDDTYALWDRYFGDESGNNWTVHTFDVIQTYLTDAAGNQTVNMTENSGINYTAQRNVTLSNSSANKGFNYTSYTAVVAPPDDTLDYINSTIPLSSGEVIFWWNRTGFNWEPWIAYFSESDSDQTVERYDVFCTKVGSKGSWLI